MKRVLVLSPHPDDEAIGCGGTLRKHVVEGDVVEVVFLTSGERGGHGQSPARTRQLREGEARRAAAVLGIGRVEFWGEPDGGLAPTAALTRRLEGRLRRRRPAVIYLPHPREQHPDHRATVRLLRAALAGEGASMIRPAIRMFEVWTPLQRLDEIVDISAFVDRKRAAIRAYRSQCAVVAFDQAALGLNRYRGEMHSWPGGNYAEVFSILRL